ncbi:S-adenosylmethionine mitochondrial carrier protein-like [Rhizophagus clarus]|uniref:S-adenosylmethionine mitochondrial carrier protein-like n=1 Tax=Rhizophagus clarus TaxID=94130 RepID=A0A8H3R7J0_9GLOM|nr:S-adenosylmethionine mitochondrial carrier protein-like [Rhizophagus clarus]
MDRKEYNFNMKQALMAGGIAGTAVDVALFPLDTLKTRLQSKSGFRASGGFRGIYSGLTSAVIGSSPGASAFFVTYESMKKELGSIFPDTKYLPFIHMISASGGEVASCMYSLKTIFNQEGLKGFYRGYFSTVFREIPFTCLQFPFYEYLKIVVAKKTDRNYVEPWEAAICGSIAGGTAAAVTTPLDVIKTRVMLSAKGQTIHNYSGTVNTFNRILHEEGIKALFSGIVPRVIWIGIGGSIFLGVYEKAKKTLCEYNILN